LENYAGQFLNDHPFYVDPLNQASVSTIGYSVTPSTYSSLITNSLQMVEWLAIVYDKPGTDRTELRPLHLKDIPPAVESGIVTNAGAIYHGLDFEGKPSEFAGSAFNLVADTKEEALEFLKKDVYAKSGIWDVDNILIFPYGCAYRKGKDLPK